MPKGKKKSDKTQEEEEDVIWVPKEDTDWIPSPEYWKKFPAFYG